MIVFCDLDGTLCDDVHRRRWALIKKWDVYHGLCTLDAPHEDVLSLLYNWAIENHTIVIITGRSEKYKEETVAWLRKHGVPFDYLHMRPEGDHLTRTVALKQNWMWQYDLVEQDHVVIENDPVQAAMLFDMGYLVWNILRGDENE